MRRKWLYPTVQQMSALQPVEGPCWSRWTFLRELQPVDRTYAGAGRKREVQGEAEKNGCSLATAPHTTCPWAARVGSTRSDAEPGRRQGKVLFQCLSCSFPTNLK